MPTLKLNEKLIASLPPGEYHAQGIPKLYVRVSPTGRRVYVLRAKVDTQDGKRINAVTTLGPTTKLTFKEACLKAHLSSPSRLEERVTLFTVLDEHRETLSPTWRPATIRSYKVYADYLINRLGSRPIGELTRAELVTAISNYTTHGKVASNRLLSFTKSALRWAQERGFIDSSPAEALTPRIAGGAEVSRDRILSDEEVRAQFRESSPHAALLRFLLLTGMRIQEAQRAQRQHLDGTVLTIPAAHAKNKKERRVYLTPLALEQLAPTEQPTDLLFRSVSPTAVQARLKRQGVGYTPHDLRRTMASIAASEGIPPHIIARLLGHTDKSGSNSLHIYNRYDYEQEQKDAAAAVAARVALLVMTPPQ